MTSKPEKTISASQDQLNYLIDFMRDNPKFSCNALSRNAFGKVERDKMWMEVVEVLNSIGGAVKTVEQWQEAWRELKEQTRSKIAPKTNREELTEVERRVMDVIGGESIEHSDSDPEFEYCSESPPSSNTSEKGLHMENSEAQPQTNFLVIARKQADTLKTLAESNAASAEVSRKQADSLRLLAECSAANIEMMECMSQSIKSMNEGIKANADALKNLTNAINRIGNMASILGKRKKSEVEESNISHSELMNDHNKIIKEEEQLYDPSQQIQFIIKSEKDD